MGSQDIYFGPTLPCSNRSPFSIHATVLSIQRLQGVSYARTHVHRRCFCITGTRRLLLLFLLSAGRMSYGLHQGLIQCALAPLRNFVALTVVFAPPLFPVLFLFFSTGEIHEGIGSLTVRASLTWGLQLQNNYLSGKAIDRPLAAVNTERPVIPPPVLDV